MELSNRIELQRMKKGWGSENFLHPRGTGAVVSNYGTLNQVSVTQYASPLNFGKDLSPYRVGIWRLKSKK
jgi:hypothetical protein